MTPEQQLEHLHEQMHSVVRRWAQTKMREWVERHPWCSVRFTDAMGSAFLEVKTRRGTYVLTLDSYYPAPWEKDRGRRCAVSPDALHMLAPLLEIIEGYAELCDPYRLYGCADGLQEGGVQPVARID